MTYDEKFLYVFIVGLAIIGASFFGHEIGKAKNDAVITRLETEKESIRLVANKKIMDCQKILISGKK